MSNPETAVTSEIAEFVSNLKYGALPSEAVRIAKRCVVDGLGVILAGSSQSCTQAVLKTCKDLSNAGRSTAFGISPVKYPPTIAALVNGTAGHAMDWDDTQLSTTPDRIFGLLTHPTIPPLSACLALAESLEAISGKDFLTAFLAGFEVECKIAEAIYPTHYKQGFHSSGTIGVFGSAMAASKLLGLDTTKIRHALGMAASMGSGIRVNFGTMTKPLHVGMAAQNGVMAALLAREGYEANLSALDGTWGFFQVQGGGFDLDRISGHLGNPYTIVDPGVSVKPYPCGSLTHPSMDAMLALVVENDIQPDDIQEVVLFAGTNILNPIRYETANDELEAKFCMPFLLAAIAISRKAGSKEFTKDFVLSPQVRSMMKRIRTQFDPEIEAKGWDKMRSRVEVTLRDGTKLVREAGGYRGGPDLPLSDEELQAKFNDCAEEILSSQARQEIIATITSLDSVKDVRKLTKLAQTLV
jgi:2-methylcitrate dehydratase PrpD